MKHLSRGILEDYEITGCQPERVCAIQFGDDACLMGVADRLLDDANRAGAHVGLAVVQSGSAGHAGALKSQDGIYTVVIRGELNGAEVNREQVVQCVLAAYEPEEDDEALRALARSGEVEFGLMHRDETGEFAARNAVNVALAARFLVERFRAGLKPMAMIVLGDSPECARDTQREIGLVLSAWRAGADCDQWMAGCRFFPALAESMVCRSDGEEAARLCRKMNYADAMIHLAEPYARWTIQADEEFQRAFPLEGFVEYTRDIGAAFDRKHRLFDAGLGVMAALGCLRGNLTLKDCMKDELLRRKLGDAFYNELIPFAPMSREDAAEYVIACCERYENSMQHHFIMESAHGLIRRINVGILPAIRAYQAEHFTLPEGLTLALAATVALYSRVRFNGQCYELNVGEAYLEVHDGPEILRAFSRLAPDMTADSLTYAALADRELWQGADLREIDGLAEAVEAQLAANLLKKP